MLTHLRRCGHVLTLFCFEEEVVVIVSPCFFVMESGIPFLFSLDGRFTSIIFFVDLILCPEPNNKVTTTLP